MKLKIRGLVFVGFAAAVFAQSALAVDSDDKTVTSKTYVDSKIEASNNGTATTISEDSPDTRAPSSKNVYLALQAVQTQVSGIDVVSGNETYVSVTEGSGSNAGTFTVSTAQAPATTNDGITGTLDPTTTTGGVTTPGTEDALVTAKAVKSLIDTSLSDASGAEDNTTMPTSAAVVSYAEKKANKATSISTTSGGNYTSDTEYPTTKAVYDFVTGTGTTDGFQPKTHVDLTNNEANNSLKFGMGEGSWGVVRAYGQTSPGQTANSYLQIMSETERDTYSIGIVPSKVASHGASGGSGGNVYSNQILSGSDSLATANAVYEYAVKQQWDAQNDVGKHLVIDSNGVVALSTEVNPDIPVPTDSRCVGENSTHVCALVAYWAAASTDPVTNEAIPAGVRYEWTVMAPTN